MKLFQCASLFLCHLTFAFAFEDVEIGNEVADHSVDFRSARRQQFCPWLKVAGNPAAKALGLADVQNPPGGVLKKVHARGGRQLRDLLADLVQN